MRHLLLAAAAVCALQAAPAVLGRAEAAPAIPTIQQLAAFDRLAGFDVSPDGKHLVALEGQGENRVILVWDTDNLAAAPTRIGSQNMKIQAVGFAKNDVLFVQLWQPYDLKLDTTTRTFINKLYLTDLKGSQWREPIELPRARTDFEEREQAVAVPDVLDSLPNDPDHILVVNGVGVNAGDVYKVNVRTGRSERVQRSAADVGGYVTDLNGDVRARTRSGTDGRGAYVATEIKDARSGQWQEHARTYARDRQGLFVVGFAKDPNIAYVLSNVGRDKRALFEYDVANRKLGEIAFEHKFFEASAVSVWPYKDENFGELVAFGYEGPRAERHLVSPRFLQIEDALNRALKIEKTPLKLVDPATGATATTPYETGRYARLESYSKDLNTAVVWVGSADDPGEYFLLKDKSRLTSLSKARPDLDPAALGTTSLVYYTARDGLAIPAFLTLPPKSIYGEGPYPTVIHPHGGPWSRDDMTFDWSMWVPMMASRGYAVLRPQFRGSDGWGARLWKAGDAEWGQKMQDDKDDGAKWLIEQKIAIPGRIAMFGFSYGGYASMAASERPNGLYKCAIAGAGVSDIKRIWARFFTNQWFRDAQAPTVDGLNPLSNVAEVKIPIAVYHGVRDQTVPIEQSRWFVGKARGLGKDVVYQEFVDYSHGPAWTRQINAEQLAFIDGYLRKGCAGGL